eukprot:46669_1
MALIFLYVLWLIQINVLTGDFVLVEDYVSWGNAEDYCNNTCNSHLISIHSQETFNEIIALAADFWNNRGISRGQYLWIGLKDIDGNYNFSYTDGTMFDYGSDFSNPPWTIGQPANFGQNILCVAIFRQTLELVDTYCSTNEAFICNGTCGLTRAPTPSPTIRTFNPTGDTSNPTFNPTTVTASPTLSVPVNST